jgi:hypothetical protein
MSYGVKYRNTYTDLLGVSHQVDILEQDYAGGITSVSATQNPVIFAWDPDNDTKYPTSLASSIDISFRSPSRQFFRSLFTASKFKYQVKHYTAAVVDWIGFILPDLYSEAYEKKDFAVNIKAADGLGLLQGMDFVDANGLAYTGRKSDFDIIKIMLDKIGNERNIYTAIDIYEESMAHTNADDPLKQAYTDCDIFYDMNCAEVLEEILKPYGAILFQDASGWGVVRFSQLYGSYVRRAYSSAGTYTGNTTFNPGVTLTNEMATVATRNVMVMGATSMRVIPAIKKLRINQDYGYKDNMVPGGNMLRKEFGPLTDTVQGKSYKSKIWKMKRPNPFTIDSSVWGKFLSAQDGQMYIRIDDFINDGFSRAKDIAKWAESSFYIYQDTKSIALDFEFRLSVWRDGDGYVTDWIRDLYIQIQVGTYYLTVNGWLNSAGNGVDTYIKLSNQTSSISFNTYHLEADTVPTSGTMYVRIFQVCDPDPITGSSAVWLDVKSIKLQLTDVDTEMQFDTIIDDLNNIIPEDIDIMCADIPDMVNNRAIYANGKYLSNGTPTKDWKELGSNTVEPLLVSLARIISDQYLVPTISYDAVIRHAHLSVGSVISDPWDSLKYRILAIKGFNVAECEMSATLCEVLATEILVTENGENIITENSEAILIT